MKKLFGVMAAAIAVGVFGPAIAASSVDLSVKGSITPAACTPTLSSGGRVDHGKIALKDLSFNRPTALPVVTLQFAVDCAASTLIAIKSRDNRAGSSGEGTPGLPNFGLGLVNGDKKIGWFLLKMANAQADNVVRPLIESNDGQTWSDASYPDLVWQVNGLRALGSGTGGAPSPLPVQKMTVDLLVETMMVQRQNLPHSEEFPIDGSATLDIVYL